MDLNKIFKKLRSIGLFGFKIKLSWRTKTFQEEFYQKKQDIHNNKSKIDNR